jgi:ectoine utilization protein EutC
MLILQEADIRSTVSLDDESIAVVADGFRLLSEGKATMPPVVRIDIPENRGEVDIKTAHVHGWDEFAIKIASGFLANPEVGLPYGSGLMVVLSAKTGAPDAILLDNGYLTELRTGIAGAIAATYLAPAIVDTAGVIGSGSQARYQVRGLKHVRDFGRLLVYSRDPANVERYAHEMSLELGIRVAKAGSVEEVVRASEAVVTTTAARKPYLKGEWLHKGMHITCMGSDAEHKQELYPDVFSKVDRIVCDSKSQCFSLGELHHALDAGVLSPADEIAELGQILSGAEAGRQDEEEVTICDLTGVGVQDTAIALLCLEKARREGLGMHLI